MKRLIKYSAAGLAAAVALTFSGCTGSKPTAQSGDIKVVTVNFPPYDFVKQITGGDIVPEMLLTGGQDTHTYEPTAKDIIRINEADIFICTGGESDAWVDRIAGSLDGNVRIVKMTDCINELIEEDHDEHEHIHEYDDGEIEYDEHVWTSPENAVKISEGITEALIEADPANSEKYNNGLNAYINELHSLSEDLHKAAEALDKPLIFGDRFPFAYMARDYGISYFAAFAGCSSDTEPSAAKMTELIDKAKETGVKVIYHIEFSTEKVAAAIAEAVGAEIRLMHSCHTLSDKDLAAGETYVSIRRKNIEAMK